MVLLPNRFFLFLAVSAPILEKVYWRHSTASMRRTQIRYTFYGVFTFILLHPCRFVGPELIPSCGRSLKLWFRWVCLYQLEIWQQSGEQHCFSSTGNLPDPFFLFGFSKLCVRVVCVIDASSIPLISWLCYSFEERLAAQRKEKEELAAAEELGFKKPLSKEEKQEKKKQRLAAIGEDLLAIAADQPFRFPATFTFVVRAFSGC